jgi:hypothetical protein
MFDLIKAWIPGILILSIVLHIIVFYFGAGSFARKNSESLNKLMERE